MQYKNIYNQIIKNAKNRILSGYNEKHHIIPKCLGGSNSKENIVKLTFREHFICHRLLCKMYPNNSKIHHAFSSMVRVSKTNSKRLDVLTSRHFDIVKRAFAPFAGKWNIGRTAWNKGLSGEKHSKHYKNGKINIPNMTGYKWINNGINQTKIPPNTNIPEGWTRGRMDLIGENNPMKNKEIATKNANLRKKK